MHDACANLGIGHVSCTLYTYTVHGRTRSLLVDAHEAPTLSCGQTVSGFSSCLQIACHTMGSVLKIANGARCCGYDILRHRPCYRSRFNMSASMSKTQQNINVLAHLTNIVFLVLSVSASTDLVEIDGEYNTSRFANIEAKQLRIRWESQLHIMPAEAIDFLASQRRGLWRSALDGPAETDEQVLMV